MSHGLLAYLSADFSDDDVRALRELVTNLASSGGWSHKPPMFVDEVDDSSCTRPEDEPVRTVGVLLKVSEPGESPMTLVDELMRLLDALSLFSSERGVELEVQLDDTYVGEIRNGVPDRLIREGLLARW
ncbi:MAG TPA: hypothetical protein VFZ09_28310 [Archangium sp.]|uniref:hypothetical protein n=1 Tax=Archangium sp. TaxID=1872627 RepID=UPI002E348E22|nr:hypothetical protein [Archangium sp.]HEX5750167.1 hypothetical protein [Archangium sp.]